MATMTLKGHTFNTPQIRDSFDRRAVFFQNKIFDTLAKLNLTPDEIDVNLQQFAFKKAPASATWYVEGYHLHYSYDGLPKYVENLAVVSKILEFEVNQFVSGQKTFNDFMKEFTEDKDVADQRKAARELLGVAADERDLAVIDKKYKDLAKAAHPDMGGDVEHFKDLNRAHKLLRKELQ
ncbi:MAG TPA: DnaJ domain-containing protein [Acidobacteriota bacterium]|nr:DnaJ domain-containing protein [Acidobacteriota bacterium]